MESFESLFIGIDVGTGSARAALVTDKGKILKTSVKSIKTWTPCTDHYEQSSDDIWNACRSAVKDVIDGYAPCLIKGIGFDATCSLVVLSKEYKPLSVSTTKNDDQNIILWMDHRAKSEADFINKTEHSVLKYVGGKVSLEMQMPKLLWLKRNLGDIWQKIGLLFDLPDYLTWRATDSQSRSLCSVVCKWNYEAENAENMHWNSDFLKQIDLYDLVDDRYNRIGNEILPPGAPCGKGLSKLAAEELGLLEGTAVGTSIIDAHAGGLGMLGCIAKNVSNEIESRLSLICGTSTCHMAVNKSQIFASGIWGPYYSAMVPGLWLNEAGQSASGILIEHIINNHPAASAIKSKCSKGMLVQEYLNQFIAKHTHDKGLSNNCYLTKKLHVWPDFHGNRSPIGDPNLLGMISGLTLTNDEENLALLYLAVLQGLSYGTKHIIEHLKTAGYESFECILICGGLSQNKLYVQIQSDVVGLPVLCPKEKESVLLGSSILGACGAKYYQNVESAIRNMGGEAIVVQPDINTKDYHSKKYKVFLKMLEHQLYCRDLMN